MGKFNWWHRFKKKKPLSKKDAFRGKSFLLQQIEHGDFDFSDYRRQALYELELCQQEKAQVIKNWVASEVSLKEKLDEIERKYNKRYKLLMLDYDDEENRLLSELRRRLVGEFGIDCWDEVIEMNPEQTVEQMYYNYQTMARSIKQLLEV
jgi:hypothetical protein